MTPDEAKAELQKRGIQFADSRFLKAVRAGDLPLVKLFLDAGSSHSAKGQKGVSAVTEAARRGHSEVANVLLDAGADRGDLVAAAKRESSRKDGWEKLASFGGVLTFLSSLTIAAAGWYFTTSYNNRQLEIAKRQNARDLTLKQEQNRITEMQTVEKFIPHFSEGEESKRASLLAIKVLARPGLWAELAELNGGSGSVDALRQGARGPNGQKQSAAVQALSHIASRANDADATRAKGALTDLFAIERSAMVKVTSGNTVCSGFSLAAQENLVVTVGCVKTNAMVEIETSDHQKMSAMPVLVRPETGFALLRLSGQLPKPLLLAEKAPLVGSVAVGLVFDREGNAQTLPGRIDGVDMSVDLKGSSGNLNGRDWIGLAMEGGALPGSAGSPILDETGKVVCALLAATPSHAFCLPLGELKPYL